MSSSKPDAILSKIADYVLKPEIKSAKAHELARYCLMDALACAFEALAYPECTKLLGPVVRGTVVPGGSRVPGTAYELDPVKAAFDITTAIRWLDFNDAWFGAEGGHPSDNLGAILAVADYLTRGSAPGRSSRSNGRRITMGDILTAMIKAYEVQGGLQYKNALGDAGLDSTALVTVASSAIAAQMLGGTRQQIINAVSNAWADGAALRLFRVGHSTGWRKSWASGDSASRGVRHGLMALAGEMGYPTALTVKKWGFNEALLRGKPVVLGRPLGSYIMENILFKVPFPAQFHTQTASECAVRLHPLVKDRIADIQHIAIRTHGRTLQTADKSGPLSNAADRDHCIQYIVAICLLHGRLTGEDYEDGVAADPRIDALRAKTTVTEDESFTRDFYDDAKQMNTNALRITFKDGSATEEVRIDYPLGHKKRRREGLPLVEAKFRHAVGLVFDSRRARQIVALFADAERLNDMPFPKFMNLLVR